MKHVLLACALAVCGAAHAQPAPRCAGTPPASGAPDAACAKAPPASPAVPPVAVPGPAIGPSLGKAEHAEGLDPRQTPYKAGLRQQCDAMAQMLKPDHKLTPSQEAQVRAQHRAFHC